MKNIFKILTVALVSVLLFSCEKDEDQATLEQQSSATISADKATVVLNEVIASQPAVNFAISQAQFNIKIVPVQQLEIALKGGNFKNSSTIDVANNLSKIAVTHAQLNAAMYSIGATPDLPNQTEVRLKTVVGPAVFYSNVVTATITPYTPNPDLIYPKIQVPGGYAGAAGYDNWEPKNSPNLFSPAKDDKYRGFIYVSSDKSEFKFAINNDWAGNKGDDGSGTGKLKVDGANIPAKVAGTYYLKVDWAANTYSAVLANFGVIGDATPTGWNSDTDFVYNPTTKTYVINSIALSSGGVFKFRANDGWDIKIQPASADQVLVSGKAVTTYLTSEGTVTGDSSYKVETAGNYKIELDLHNSANYKLTVTKL